MALVPGQSSTPGRRFLNFLSSRATFPLTQLLQTIGRTIFQIITYFLKALIDAIRGRF
jgi:hypothetical protein